MVTTLLMRDQQELGRGCLPFKSELFQCDIVCERACVSWTEHTRVNRNDAFAHLFMGAFACVCVCVCVYMGVHLCV